MYKKDLDKHIQNSTTSGSFILYGESHYLIDEYVDILIPNEENISILKLYFDEYSYDSAKAHLSQASLFGDKNVLIIKSDKKIPKKELETLALLCEKDKNNTLIFAYMGDDYSAYSNALAKTKIMSVRFFNPNRFESLNILAQKASSKNIKIDTNTLGHLLNAHNLDIALAVNELEKLSIFNNEITTKDIDSLIYGLSEISLNDFVKKVAQKKEFMKDLQNILAHSIDEIEILNAISRYFTQLSLFNIYIRVHGSHDTLEILGYMAPKFIADEMALLSAKIKPYTYHKILKLIAISSLKMKQSNIDKESILLYTINDIYRIL